MTASGVQRYACRLRKTLLAGVDVSSILELSENHQKALERFKRQRRGFAGQPSEKFAFAFCNGLDLLDKRFLSYEKKFTDNFPWTKFYESFHEYLKNHCETAGVSSVRERFLNLAPPWFEKNNPNLSYGPRTQKAILALRFYLREENLAPLLENYRFLSRRSQNHDIKYDGGGYLIRFARRGDRTEIKIHHSFGTLPVAKTRALLNEILENRAKISNEFLKDEAYQTADRQLKDYQRDLPDGRGVFRDVEAVTGEVIRRYFPEMQTPPRVFWFEKYTTRKLAHYDISRDEIGFSLIFDLPEADPRLLEFLAYHELLHRKLGLEIRPGRILAHTGKFRQMEQRFPDFEIIDRQLNRYARGETLSV